MRKRDIKSAESAPFDPEAFLPLTPRDEQLASCIAITPNPEWSLGMIVGSVASDLIKRGVSEEQAYELGRRKEELIRERVSVLRGYYRADMERYRRKRRRHSG